MTLTSFLSEFGITNKGLNLRIVRPAHSRRTLERLNSLLRGAE